MSVFTQSQENQVSYSTFNLSHQRKFSFNAGYMIPTLMQECLPGDSWDIKTNQLMRMMPMLAPVMHEVKLKTEFWFVPYRLLWQEKKFEEFITGGDTGMSAVAFPTISNVPANNNNPANYARNRLADYLGLPAVQSTSASPVYDAINPLPFLAYALVYFEYYRDQNLEPFDFAAFDITTWSGYPMLDYNALTDFQKSLFTTLRKRAWEHDYFTSALPYPQKGEPVRMPLGDTAPIIYNPEAAAYNRTVPYSDNPTHIGKAVTGLYGNPDGNLRGVKDGGTQDFIFLDNSQSLLADLSEASSATVLEMRKAIALQQWLESRMRMGSRYVEYTRADFKVTSSDARLQRPEFAGGSTVPVLISETLQTSSTQDNSTPLGEMAGHGVSMGGGFIASKFCEEHGFMIAVTTCIPATGYHQGMAKIWKKFDKFDYGTPMMQHIGEQEITSGELYYTANESEDSDTFGYIPRYSEYKFINNSVHGYFKNNLEYWTWDRKFGEKPTLSKEFIGCNPSRDIFALTDETEDTLLCQMFHDIKVKRPLSYFSSPGLERI